MTSDAKAGSNQPISPWVGATEPATTSAVHLPAETVLAKRYRVRRLLGSGGMADVYEAWDQELDEAIAVKVLHSAGRRGGQIERFKQEIKLARKIVHPNVCRIYDFGSSGELKFVTMELLHGSTLDVFMTAEPPATGKLDVRVALFREILDGLDAAHAMGIIHRDLKPQNVMITPEGRAVIMDFGIARRLETGELTTAGEVLGTPAYMAPERLLGGKVDLRSDIYSLGIILFELAIGKRPFSGITIFDMARNQLSIDPPLPSELDPDLPKWLEVVILKMLAKRPEERYQSVAEVTFALPSGADVKSVLLVDDDSTMLTLVGVHLNQAGISVVTAKNGPEGIERVLSKEPDLLCLDFSMPQMDGFQVADTLRRLGSKVPIFMLTGMQDPQYEKQANRLGIEQFFTKPLDIEGFVQAVCGRLLRPAP